MAKIATFVLVLSLVLFVSAQSVIGEESPSIYEQIDKATDEAKGAIKEAASGSAGTPAKEADGSSQSRTSWVESKIEGLFSGGSQPTPSAGPAQAPSPSGGSANAPTA